VVGTYTYDGEVYEITAREAIAQQSSLDGIRISEGTYAMPAAESVLSAARTAVLMKDVEGHGITVSDEELLAYASETFGTDDIASLANTYGMDEETAKMLTSSFGGGMGRMRLVCGAASGMFMLAGLQNGSCTPHDNEGKMANYAFVQDLAGQFKGKYGSLICAELLGLAPKGSIDPRPAERTPEYYEKRPCPEMIAEAVRLYLRSINSKSRDNIQSIL
jgi:C_GCAxxG_C_C family probable redox protein